MVKPPAAVTSTSRRSSNTCSGGCQPWLARMCHAKAMGCLGAALVGANLGWHEYVRRHLLWWVPTLVGTNVSGVRANPVSTKVDTYQSHGLGWHECVRRPYQHRVDQGRHLPKPWTWLARMCPASMPTPCRPRSTPTKARELHVRYRRAETVAARGARQQQEHQHHQAHHWHEHQQVPPPG